MPSQTKRVLVIDDQAESHLIERLLRAYESYNQGLLDIPDFRVNGEYKFEVTLVSEAARVAQELERCRAYHVFVVDRKFVEKDLNIRILRVLRDLHDKSVRIVWTAFGDANDIVNSMRLGAWDYIYKSQINPESDIAVVSSTLRGLRERTVTISKMEFDHEAHEYVRQHSADYFRDYEGKFIAMAKIDEAWRTVKDDTTLFGLYSQIETTPELMDAILHITHIGEIGENDNDSTL